MTCVNPNLIDSTGANASLSTGKSRSTALHYLCKHNLYQEGHRSDVNAFLESHSNKTLRQPEARGLTFLEKNFFRVDSSQNGSPG